MAHDVGSEAVPLVLASGALDQDVPPVVVPHCSAHFLVIHGGVVAVLSPLVGKDLGLHNVKKTRRSSDPSQAGREFAKLKKMEEKLPELERRRNFVCR